jgi:lipoprotein-releasing system permease protein
MVVAFVTMSLVTALSVFNGLEDLIKSLYNTFDPEIKIVAVKGKTFPCSPDFIHRIENIEGVYFVTEVIEDNALLKYKEEQIVVKVRGVSENFVKLNRMDSMIIEGDFALHKGSREFAIIGRGIQYLLSITLTNDMFPLQLLYPKNNKIQSIDPQKLISKENILPGAVFAIEKQYDDNYIFVPLSFAMRLFNYTTQRTSIEISMEEHADISKVKGKLQKLLGHDFLVQDSDEQHANLLRAVKIEKLFMHFTLSFILAIASFNIFFCLTMLAIKKQKDVAILFSLGATCALIRKIFLLEGALIAFSGASIGLVLGVLLCLAQQKYGFVSMGMETSIVDAYPVKMKLADFISTAFTLIVITFITSYRPASRAANIDIKSHI